MNHIMNVLDEHMQRPTPLVQKAAIYLYIGKNIYLNMWDRDNMIQKPFHQMVASASTNKL